MKNSKPIKKTIIYCLCGAIMVPTFTGYVCSKGCPDSILEKHDDLPESRYIETTSTSTSVSNSRVAASGTTTTTVYPYLNNIDRGGES